MLSEEDQLKAQFAPGDSITFGYQDYLLEGRIIRLNPKRAVVLVDDCEFSVPYNQLTPDQETAQRRMKTIEAVHQTALRLLAEHKLFGWNFRFDHSTRRAGCCDFTNKSIHLSFHLAQSAGEEDIRDTLLHEIAHALVGPNHHHDTTWKTKALEIGCTGKRTHNLEFTPPRWNVTCENDCWTSTAQQQSSNLRCRSCGSRLLYTPH